MVTLLFAAAAARFWEHTALPSCDDAERPGPAGHELGAQVRAALARQYARPVAARLRTYFLTGLLVTGPVAVTLHIVGGLIATLDAQVIPHVPRLYNPQAYLPFPMPGLGLLLAILGLTLSGALTANLLGRSLLRVAELALARMPIVGNLYSGLKQRFHSVVVTAAAGKRSQNTALFQFPAPGIWSLGFITGAAARVIEAQVGSQELVSVFVLHGVLPPSGVTCFVPRRDLIPLPMTIEEAIRLILSAGIVSPQKLPNPASGGHARRGALGTAPIEAWRASVPGTTRRARRLDPNP
jgi:uncharacterized membrane protein